MLLRYCLGSGQLQRINGSAAKPSTIVQTVLARMFAFADLISDSSVMKSFRGSVLALAFQGGAWHRHI
ncbi:hypothetical protein BE61_00100 [Bradyrhizobium elkanii USDA 61]|nr:hypothetical protein BE61_00100 [Bradyrhizobium elkanii USDA 61]